MISRTTFLWLLLAAVVGYGLFHVKYQVVALEEELSRLNGAILREQNQIHVLEAEWSYLNQPARLEELNDRHLHLKPIAAGQFGSIASLPMRPEPSPDGEERIVVGSANMIAKILPPRRPALPGAAPVMAIPAGPALPAAARRPAAAALTPNAILPVSVPR